MPPLAPANPPRSVPSRAAAWLSISVAALAWMLVAGKDLPWDTLHYHLYAGLSALDDRLTQDFLAAGPQSTLNPYSHLPLTLMVRAGWPAWVIGSVLALAHGTILWMAWELAVAVRRRSDGAAVAVFAVALAALNPVLLQELGSTFNDISTGIPVVAAWALLARAFHAERPARLAAIAGVLAGAAAALKLSNALPALAAAAVVLCLPHKRWSALLSYALCAGAGFVLVGGPWAWRLWQVFGNPLFPLFNNVFGSPDFLTDAVKDYRFIPETAAAAFRRPFEMLRAARLVHTEVMAPDARYAALLLLPLAALALRALRRRAAATDTRDAAADRAFAAVALGFAVAWVLWLTVSGNSRYFVPMGCVAGVLLAAGIARACAGLGRAAVYLSLLLVGVQGVQLALATDARWNPAPWSGPWVEVSIPERLRREPALYLGIDSQSNSFLSLFLAPGSSFMSISGAYAIAPDRPGGQRATALIERHRSQLRLLTRIRAIESDGTPIAPDAAVMNGPLRRFGLRADTTDCDFIAIRDTDDAIQRSGPHRMAPELRTWRRLYTCRVVASDEDLGPYERRRLEVDLVLDRVEDACPAFFQPRRMPTQAIGPLWQRNYMSTDLSLWLTGAGTILLVDSLRSGGETALIGRESDWARAPQKLACWRDGGYRIAAAGPE